MTSDPTTPAEFWEARYSGSDRVWSGRVNAVLAEVAGALAPGRALDLGCGEGGDAIWLARTGWKVTGVDLSVTAIARARAAAAAAGIPDEQIRLVAADLVTWSDGEVYDLVAASFLHSWPVEIPREAILRRAAGFVGAGGQLLIVAHAAAPPWAEPEMGHGHRFPRPADELGALGLDPDRWDIRTAVIRDRQTTGPDGQEARLQDSIVLVRRRPQRRAAAGSA